jgi:hypothetical protein
VKYTMGQLVLVKNENAPTRMGRVAGFCHFARQYDGDGKTITEGVIVNLKDGIYGDKGEYVSMVVVHEESLEKW